MILLSQFPSIGRSPLRLATLLISLSVAVAQTAVAQNRIGSGKVDELYQSMCAACHGKDLHGGSAPSLIDDEWIHGSSDADMARIIRDGVPEMGMIAYSAVLSEEEIRSLVIYMREMKLLNEQQAVLEKTAVRDGVVNSELERFRIETVVEHSGILWSVDWMPDGRMILADKAGDVLIESVAGSGQLNVVKGTPAVWARGQGGLMEVQLHPDYEQNGWVYLAYSKSVSEDAGGLTAIQRGKINENNEWVDAEMIFDPDVKFHSTAGYHFGTRLVFQDGYLFFAIGDRGARDLAQDLGKPNGKVHRIYDDGRIPEDNPWSEVEGSFPSAWSMGHRNPQGLDVDPRNGNLWETEHGPRGGDETNLIEPGLNYGWPVITYGMNYDGSPITDLTEYEGMEQPELYWTPSIAVCGIDFYEGDLFPRWKYNLFVGGLASEEVRRLVIEGEHVIHDEIILKNEGRVRDVANGPDGCLYVVLNGGGVRGSRIVRLAPVGGI